MAVYRQFPNFCGGLPSFIFAMKLHFINNIKIIRESKDLTQGDLADMINTKRSTFKDWEQGNSLIPAEKLYAISIILAVPLNKILDVTGGKPPPSFTEEGAVSNSNNVEGKLEAIEHLLEKTRGELLMIVSDGDTSLVRKINKRRGKPGL